jgi:hypothetical protein
VSEKDSRPTLVFITGWKNQQKEYQQMGYPPDDFAHLSLIGKSAKDDHVMDRLISLLERDFNVIKVPSQFKKTAIDDLEKKNSSYPRYVMWNKGGVISNGASIYRYLKANDRLVKTYQRNGKELYSVRPFIIISYSKGGLDSRAFLDHICKGFFAGADLRDKCRGVIQVGSPNYGSPQAYTQFTALWRAVQAKNFARGCFLSDSEAKQVALDNDPAVNDLRKYRWYTAGPNNDYNNKFQNEYWQKNDVDSGPIPYWRLGGNAWSWTKQDWAGTDGVVPLYSAKGPHQLVDSGGTFTEMKYGIHNGGTGMWWLSSFSGFFNGTSIMYEKDYDARTFMHQYATNYVQQYINVIEEATGVRVATYAPLQISTTAALAAPVEGEKAPQLITAVELSSGSAETTIEVAVSGNLLIRDLPVGSAVSVTDKNGDAVSSGPVMDTFNDPDSEFDQQPYLVAVSEPGTYTVGVVSPDGGGASVYEFGGPELDVAGPTYAAADESIIITMSVSASDGTMDTAWDYEVSVDGRSATANDTGAWPDASAGDGVASTVLPPLGAGVHSLEVIGKSRDDGAVRTGGYAIVGLDTGAVQVGGDFVVSRYPLSGLISQREIAVNLYNSSDDTSTIQIECDLIAIGRAETVMCSAATTVPPNASVVCTVVVSADRLAEFGDGAVVLSDVRAVTIDPESGDSDVSAAALPLGSAHTVKTVFYNDMSQIELISCAAEVESGFSADGKSFTAVGSATENGSSIDGVDYSLDDGATWYSAYPSDGAWGEVSEDFRMGVTVPALGDYILMVRPVTASQRWEVGEDVPIKTIAAQ